MAPEVRCDRLLPPGKPVVELAEKACVVVVGVAVETEAVVGIPVAVVEDDLGRMPKGQVTSCCAYAHLSRFKLFLMELLAFGKKLLSLVFQLRKTKVKKENWFIMKVPNRLFGIRISFI